jgi:predicted dehydrogenase
MARFLAGTDPVAVYCKEWNPAGSWYDHPASAVAIFEMTDGVVFTYRGSGCAEGLLTSWESEGRVVGVEGTAKWDGGEKFQAQVVATRGRFVSEFRDLEIPPGDATDKTGGHLGLMREFVRCVQTGTSPETICSDNIKSLAMVFGAIESAEKQQRVAIHW